ncbi:MAG TPA: hypothetical protein VLH58_05190 [Candidatus Methylomirabilis sp.]|nr:hypothetical protein [Candidatus Methylomirabilis sp.]
MSLRRIHWTIMLTVGLVLAGSGQALASEASAARQSVPGGGVTVAVTYLKERADAPTFQVVLDTHSVNLDGYRFEEIVRLRDGRGGEVAPATVEDAKGSGHHRQAPVHFAWPEPRPQALELVVKGVAGVPERVFQWPLQ